MSVRCRLSLACSKISDNGKRIENDRGIGKRKEEIEDRVKMETQDGLGEYAFTSIQLTPLETT